MRRLLIYSIIILCVSSCIAFLFYHKLNIFSKKQKDLSALDYSCYSNEYNDIIFIGGSRVADQINPEIIDSVNGIKSYCVSIDGAGIVEYNLLLLKYLQNHPKPNAVFINIDLNMFYTNGPVYNITDYFSYLKDPFIYQCLSPYRAVYRYKIIQLYYKLQRMFATTDLTKKEILIKGNTGNAANKFVARGSVKRGFSAIKLKWDAESDNELKGKSRVAYRNNGIDLLKSMVDKCRQDSINIIFLFGPSYKETRSIFTNADEILGKVNGIVSAENVPVWNYRDMPISQSKDFFHDAYHLNEIGAQIYSQQLAWDIKAKLYPSDSSAPKP